VTAAHSPARLPKVWLLLGKGVGGNGQIVGLAESLGWPFEAKSLAYNALNRCPNVVLGASLLSLDRRASSPLDPPWPDLVIGASRRSAPIAQWIKRQSGGRTRLVHLLHVQAPLERFDLIITTPQYRLPVRPNILHNIAPLNRVPDEKLRAAGAAWAGRLRHLPRPHLALLVGGNSSSYVLDATTAARLGREASAWARSTGGALLLTTSARTPPAAAAALFAAIDAPAHSYRWRPRDPDNPYFAYLALADRFIVTVDSASLLLEAGCTGKPVEIFAWPDRRLKRLGPKRLLQRWTDRQRRAASGAGAAVPAAVRFYDRLVDLGLWKPPRDFDAYHRALASRGIVQLPGQATPAPPTPLTDMTRALERIRALFPEMATPGSQSPPDRGYATDKASSIR
jgi:mitochondrial fission protein ELM1